MSDGELVARNAAPSIYTGPITEAQAALAQTVRQAGGQPIFIHMPAPPPPPLEPAGGRPADRTIVSLAAIAGIVVLLLFGGVAVSCAMTPPPPPPAADFNPECDAFC